MNNDFLNIFVYNWWRSIDRKIFLTVILILLIGCLISFIATPSIALKYNLESYYFVKRHLIFVPFSFFFIFFISLFSKLGIKRLFLFLFFISIILIFISFFQGIEYKGSIRWVNIFGYTLQPSEFLKISFIIICAWVLSLKKNFYNLDKTFFSFLIYLFVSGLILNQPDFSMFIIISAVYFSQLFISGIKWKWVIIAITFFSTVIFFSYQLIDNVKRRIDNFIYNTGDNYQIDKSIQAIEEGGLFGKGAELGTVKDYIPDSHTDFIFSVIAEEFGILGCFIIIIIFSYLIFFTYKRIKNEKNIFIILSISGLIIQFSFQIIINIASTIGLIPTTGVTLPFISYGGSSMFAMSLNIGVILALTRVSYKDILMSNEKRT